jgi:hypothetical protein
MLSTDHIRNIALLLLRACILRALPNNGRCLHSRRLATGLYATISVYFCAQLYSNVYITVF